MPHNIHVFSYAKKKFHPYRDADRYRDNLNPSGSPRAKASINPVKSKRHEKRD